jgi:hypothetical protein
MDKVKKKSKPLKVTAKALAILPCLHFADAFRIPTASPLTPSPLPEDTTQIPETLASP